MTWVNCIPVSKERLHDGGRTNPSDFERQWPGFVALTGVQQHTDNIVYNKVQCGSSAMHPGTAETLA